MGFRSYVVHFDYDWGWLGQYFQVSEDPEFWERTEMSSNNNFRVENKKFLKKDLQNFMPMINSLIYAYVINLTFIQSILFSFFYFIVVLTSLNYCGDAPSGNKWNILWN